MTLLHQAAQKAVEAALRRAFSLGQTYWQQADSESSSQHRKADITADKFESLVDETLSALQQQEVPREPGWWWCANCQCMVSPRSVTYEETHDVRAGGCGHPVGTHPHDCVASPSTTQQQEAGNGSDESAADSIVAELVAGLQRAEVKRKQRLSDLPAGTCETCMGEGYLGSIESQRITDCTDCIGGMRIDAAAPSTPESAEKDDAGGGKGNDGR